MALSEWAPIIVSIAALLFVIFSFWWMHWREGHLVVSTPYSFRIAIIKDDGLIVELPLSFFNTGAAPIIVDKLLLRIKHQNTQTVLYFNATRNNLAASEEQVATQFVVNGRKSLMNVFSFQVIGNEINIDIGKWDCHLLGKLNSKKYKSLLKFSLNVKTLNESLIPRLNFDDEYRDLVQRT